MLISDSARDAGNGGAMDLVRARIRQARALLNGEGERARTGRSALAAFVIRVAGAGLAYLSQVLLARWMGSFEYGVFVLVWVWVLILGGLAPLGLSTAVTRFIPEYRETGRYPLLRGLVFGSRAIAFGVGTALMLCAFAALALFGDWLQDYTLLPAFLIMFCLPMFAVVDLQDGMARGFSWIAVGLSPPYIIRPILLLATLAAAALAGLPLTATTAAGAAVLSYWVTGAIQTLLLHRRVVQEIGRGPRAFETSLWLKTAAPLLLVYGFDLLLQNTDILVLSHYLEPSAVAIYFGALKTMGLMSFVHFAVGAAAANRFSACNARGDREGLAEAVREAVQWTFWPSLAVAVGLLAFGWPLLWLFGPEFTQGYPVMFILAIGFLTRAAAGPVAYVLNMLGEQKRCAAALSFSALTNLLLNFALIPFFGIYGAAIATAVSVGVATAAMFLVARNRLGLDVIVWSPSKA